MKIGLLNLGGSQIVPNIEENQQSIFSSGIIGIGHPAALSETTGALHAFRIPLMSVGSAARQPRLGKYDNILSTAPDIASQARVS